MATVTLKGNPIQTSGDLPQIGSKAQDFNLTAVDLSSKSLSDFSDSKIVLNIFPSIDTGTCAQSVRQFNKDAANLDNTTILCISRDLPFAQARFCGAEGIENVVMLSDYKDGSFGKSYGLNFINGPLEALNSRCVIILDQNGIVRYTEQVTETVEEPNYQSALEALSNA